MEKMRKPEKRKFPGGGRGKGIRRKVFE